jgi:hypothetical protein
VRIDEDTEASGIRCKCSGNDQLRAMNGTPSTHGDIRCIQDFHQKT